MEKRPVTLGLSDWVILTDLIKARPKKYQDRDHKGTDVYSLWKLMGGCARQVKLDEKTDRVHRAHCASLVTKLKRYIDEGHKYVEFKPFEDQEDSID
jgi:hypothetical protein